MTDHIKINPAEWKALAAATKPRNWEIEQQRIAHKFDDIQAALINLRDSIDEEMFPGAHAIACELQEQAEAMSDPEEIEPELGPDENAMHLRVEFTCYPGEAPTFVVLHECGDDFIEVTRASDLHTALMNSLHEVFTTLTKDANHV